MKIGFTGSQIPFNRLQRKSLIKLLWSFDIGKFEFHHGDCVGSDKKAFELAKEIGWFTVAHPCTINHKRAYTDSDLILEPLPPLVRNRVIVRETELLIATPSQSNEVLRSGTWSTIRYAQKLRRECYIIYPGGFND